MSKQTPSYEGEKGVKKTLFKVHVDREDIVRIFPTLHPAFGSEHFCIYRCTHGNIHWAGIQLGIFFFFILNRGGFLWLSRAKISKVKMSRASSIWVKHTSGGVPYQAFSAKRMVELLFVHSLHAMYYGRKENYVMQMMLLGFSKNHPSSLVLSVFAWRNDIIVGVFTLTAREVPSTFTSTLLWRFLVCHAPLTCQLLDR